MNKFDDFNIDLKKSGNENQKVSPASTITPIPSIISRVMNCTPNCAVPTIGAGKKPVASCHKKAAGPIQLRC